MIIKIDRGNAAHSKRRTLDVKRPLILRTDKPPFSPTNTKCVVV